MFVFSIDLTYKFYKKTILAVEMLILAFMGFWGFGVFSFRSRSCASYCCLLRPLELLEEEEEREEEEPLLALV